MAAYARHEDEMGLLERMERVRDPGGEQSKDGAVAADTLYETKNNIQNLVIEEINKQNQRDIGNELIKKLINDTVNEHIREVGKSEKQKIVEEIYNDITGYGPLEELLRDPEVTEIMVNGPEKVYIEKKGKLFLTPIRFRDDEHVKNVIDRIVSEIGRHIDEASPMVDARLKDGSRVNAVIPPISLIGPVLTIRKFSKKPITYSQLIEWGS
ncbi:MAG TPA: ATPase, T2SS/T4P/T4SS family, partial [Bacillota bacterium]|nr:ATPase, T2SS/T4P/T4SS family [Bacillota bacterium]